MSHKTLITSRDPKGLHAVRLFEVAYNRAKLDEERAQRLNERGGELQNGLAKLIAEFSTSNQFAEENVRSNYVYPENYKVKGIVEQVNILRKLFPWLGLADERLPAQPLPSDAEGWFAIPKWERFAPTYGEAVERALAIIASQRKFYNYREGQFGPTYLRQHAKTKKMFQCVGDEQKNHDILVVPAQFGFRHRGRSVRRAREAFTGNEFGLGAFAIGIMVLTHSERFVQWEQLHVDCAGDEFALVAGNFSHAPFFDFDNGKVRFFSHWFGNAHGHYGSASAFLPK